MNNNGLTDFFKEAEEEVKQQQNTSLKENDNIENNNIVEEKDVWDEEKSLDELKDELINSDNNVDNNYTQTEYNEDQTQEDNTISRNDSYKIVLTRPLKYRGKDIYVQSEDELIELAQKGMDYSLKMNKIKPYRNLLEKLENVELDKVETFINALKGDESSKDSVLELLDLEKSDNYLDNDVKEDSSSSDNSFIDKTLNDLYSHDPELHGKVIKTFNSIDNEFKYELSSNQEVFNSFIGSVINGEFEKVYPYAVKEKALNPHINWINAYVNGFNIYNNGGYKQNIPSEPMQEENKVKISKNRTIKEQYDDIWESQHTLEELEQMLVEEI